MLCSPLYKASRGRDTGQGEEQLATMFDERTEGWAVIPPLSVLSWPHRSAPNHYSANRPLDAGWPLYRAATELAVRSLLESGYRECIKLGGFLYEGGLFDAWCTPFDVLGPRATP